MALKANIFWVQKEVERVKLQDLVIENPSINSKTTR